MEVFAHGFNATSACKEAFPFPSEKRKKLRKELSKRRIIGLGLESLIDDRSRADAINLVGRYLFVSFNKTI